MVLISVIFKGPMITVYFLTSPFPTQNYCLAAAYRGWNIGVMPLPGGSMCMSPKLFLWCTITGRAGRIFYAWNY
jgi:hypothetical protein